MGAACWCREARFKMTDNSFSEEQQEQYLVKSTIVAKYFYIRANVIIITQKRYPQKPKKIAYIDLFAGPGRYKDSTQSTPLKILTNSIVKPDLRERFVAIWE